MSSKSDVLEQIDLILSPQEEMASVPENDISDDSDMSFKGVSEDSQCTEKGDEFQEFRSLGSTKNQYPGSDENGYVSRVSYTSPSIETSKSIQKWSKKVTLCGLEGHVYIRKGRIVTDVGYDIEIVKKFRKIPGREFDHDTKEWSVPISSLEIFLSVFPDIDIPIELMMEYKMHTNPSEHLIEVPDMMTFNGVLYPFQKIGVRFLITGKKVFLCDEMGLGKTVEGIAAAEILLEAGIVDKIMVFCPSTLKYQWEREIIKFTGKSVLRIVGTPKQREKLWAKARNHDFLIINYEKAINDMDNKNIMHVLDRWNFALILDEATRIKNWRSKTTKAFQRFKAPVKFMLTGTPVENHPGELYTLTSFLDTNIMGTWKKFDERYIYRNQKGWILGYRNLEELHTKISPLMLRRRKEEVMPELPEKIIDELFIDMSDIERRDYQSIIDIVMDYLKRTEKAQSDGDKSEFDINQKALFHSIQFCKMYCDHPDLVRQSESDLLKGLELKAKTSSKLEELKFLVEEIITNGNKVVIFTEFVRAAKLISKEIPGVVLYHGGLSEKEKNDRVSRFVKDPECMIFCSTDAGSHGLNLQEASSYLINFDLPWNPSVLNQRIDRVHRIGQSDTVNVINMIIEDDEMIEKEVRRVLRRKQNMFDKVIDGR